MSSVTLLLNKDVSGLNLLGNVPSCGEQLPALAGQRCVGEEVWSQFRYCSDVSSDLCEVISGLMRKLCPPKKLYLVRLGIPQSLKVLGKIRQQKSSSCLSELKVKRRASLLLWEPKDSGTGLADHLLHPQSPVNYPGQGKL